MSSVDSDTFSTFAPRFCGECGRPLKAVSCRLTFDRQTGVQQVERRLRCPRKHEDWAPVSDGAYVNYRADDRWCEFATWLGTPPVRFS